ncbi:PTS transporter subunit EIIC [Spiroplasma taiwanense]|uniref:PTS transporter subunit EIIC n=1 Tax=Spiroplasma taiwanense TaxID=2145 RepID=UPI0003F8DADB|nr:PTS transporter subunit EIIC [Spiroplasma taiwanense]
MVSGVLKNPASPSEVMNHDIASALFYVGSRVGIELIGVAFLYSTVKYLKGETSMALLLALLLTSRYIFGAGWVLFTFLGNSISIKSYESTVLPMIAAGFLVHYLNVWIKKWMPSAIDVVFRTAFVVFVSFIIIMFTVGPFFRIIEQLISQFVILLEKIPYGLGLGIFAMLWQTLVLTGTHVAVVTAISLPMTQTPVEPSVMYAALQIAIVGQIGATIAVAIRTKNNKIKQACFDGLPGSIFGITEPIIYGVNLRKFWPFLYGSFGALIGATVGGILDVHQVSRTGTGVMSYIGLGLDSNLIMGLIASAISITSAFLITFILYIDRKSEVKEFNKVSNLLFKVIISSNNIEKNDFKIINLKKELENIKNKIKLENNYKLYEKNLISLSNKEIKLQRTNEIFTTHKDKLYNRAIKNIETNKEKYNLLATNYNNYQRDEKFEKIKLEI